MFIIHFDLIWHLFLFLYIFLFGCEIILLDYDLVLASDDSFDNSVQYIEEWWQNSMNVIFHCWNQTNQMLMYTK